jgi:hypothetical protein
VRASSRLKAGQQSPSQSQAAAEQHQRQQQQQRQQPQQQQQKRPSTDSAGVNPRLTKTRIRDRFAVSDTRTLAFELLAAEVLPMGSTARSKQQRQQRPVRGTTACVDAAAAAALPSIIPAGYVPSPPPESDALARWTAAFDSSANGSDA